MAANMIKFSRSAPVFTKLHPAAKRRISMLEFRYDTQLLIEGENLDEDAKMCIRDRIAAAKQTNNIINPNIL